MYIDVHRCASMYIDDYNGTVPNDARIDVDQC